VAETLTVGGRTFRAAEGEALTFRRHRYAMRVAAVARLAEAPADPMDFLAHVIAADCAPALLAAGLEELGADGAPVPFTDAWAEAAAAHFDAASGPEAVEALTAAVTRCVLPFFAAARRSSSTSPSSSTPATPAPDPADAATGEPSTTAPRRRRPPVRPDAARGGGRARLAGARGPPRVPGAPARRAARRWQFEVLVYALLAPWQKEGSRTAPPDVPDLLTTPA
jgi:hypothetical protein